MGRGDEGEGDCGDTFELDDHVAILLDALDDSFDAGEVTIDDDATAPHFVGNGCIVEEEDAVIGDGGDSDEVLHFTVGDVEDFGTCAGIEGACHHVAEGTEVFVCHLEVGEAFTSGMHEEEIVDGWDEFELTVPIALDEFVGDGKEGFDALLIEVGLHLEFPIIGDTHGVPKGLGADVAHE